MIKFPDECIFFCLFCKGLVYNEDGPHCPDHPDANLYRVNPTQAWVLAVNSQFKIESLLQELLDLKKAR